MAALSPRQREIQEREARILKVARDMLLSRGYFGLTMNRIAESCQCPKGTMYQRFGCKEDIVLALARDSLERRSAMIARGAGFAGSTRERVVAMGEAVSLFARLHPDDARIIHTATGPIREKGSPERVAALIRMENEAMGILRRLLEEALVSGELEARGEATVEEFVFAVWALVDGSLTLMESRVHQSALRLDDPFAHLYHAFHVLADAYGWKPLFDDWDWENTLSRVRRDVFPEEVRTLYGDEPSQNDLDAQGRA